MKRTLCVLSLVTGCVYTPPTPDRGDPTMPDASDPGPDDPDDPTNPVVDTDGDGIVDTLDNCPTLANVGQADEDGDQVGNLCDNCPHVANGDQADALEQQLGVAADGVGDACDPQPTQSGNSIRLFLGFDSPDDLAGFQFAGNDSHAVTGGKLVIDGSDLAIVWKDGLGATDSHVTTEVTYTAIDQARQFRGATIMTRFRRSSDFGHGAGCGEVRDTAFSTQPYFDMVRFNGSGFVHDATIGTATVATNHTEVYTVRAPTTTSVNCTVGSMTYTRTIPAESGTGINFAVWGATAAFRYLVIID